MDKRLTYGEIISSPQFWADITKTVLIGTITIATSMMMKRAMERMFFGAQTGNIVPIRKTGL